jgi:type IV secretion system protein TrbE
MIVLTIGALIVAVLLFIALRGQGPNIVREYRTKLRSYADLLLYAGVIEDGIILNKDGALMAAWEYRGNDLDSASEHELVALSERVNGVLRRRGTGWMLHVDAIRAHSRRYDTAGVFPDRTTQLIESERREQYEAEGAHFESRFVMSLTYLPPSDTEDRIGNLFIEGDKVTESAAQRALTNFKSAIQEIEDGFSYSLRLERLRSHKELDEIGREIVYDDFLSHLAYCTTGVDHPMRLPNVPFYLDAVLGGVDFYGGLKPRIGDKQLRVITLAGFPNESFPGILESVNRLPMELRWSNRFICLDAVDARKRIDKYQKKWFLKRKSMRGYLSEQTGTGVARIDADADRMAGDAQQAIDELSSGAVQFGLYTSVIVVADTDSHRADESARQVMKLINSKGFTARLEDINAVEAFLGTHPGNGYANVRKPILHTRNLADLLPLLSVWSGSDRCPSPLFPPDSPPLMYTATSGATPFRLNLHVSDVGHTLVLGPTGAGKSTLLGSIVAQFFRYPRAQVYVFDKGYSAWPLVQASGGKHYDIMGEFGGPSFCPLEQIDDQNERLWAGEWLESLCVLQGLTLNPHHRRQITHALSLLVDSPSRTLTDLLHGPLQEPSLREALDRYTLDGPLGSLLDSSEDSLREDIFQVFELEHLMQGGASAGRNIVPVLLYLFHRIEQNLDGRPTLIVLDEAWTFIDNPLFADKIRDWLKTLRKKNACVVFATQSVSDILDKPITAAILESSPTKILLPNPEARAVNVAETYKRIGLSERQIEILAMAVPKKHYYYMSPLGNRLFDLGLGPTALAFVGATGKEDLGRIRELREEFGSDWPAEWLWQRRAFEQAARWLGGDREAELAFKVLRDYRSTWPMEWLRAHGQTEAVAEWQRFYLERQGVATIGGRNR